MPSVCGKRPYYQRSARQGATVTETGRGYSMPNALVHPVIEAALAVQAAHVRRRAGMVLGQVPDRPCEQAAIATLRDRLEALEPTLERCLRAEDMPVAMVLLPDLALRLAGLTASAVGWERGPGLLSRLAEIMRSWPADQRERLDHWCVEIVSWRPRWALHRLARLADEQYELETGERSDRRFRLYTALGIALIAVDIALSQGGVQFQDTGHDVGGSGRGLGAGGGHFGVAPAAAAPPPRGVGGFAGSRCIRS